MKRQGYGSGRAVVYETFVRASVVRCRADTEGAEAAAAQTKDELEAHFTWVPTVAAALAEYTTDRERFPTLDSFVPRIAEVLAAEVATVERDVAAASKLVSMTRPNGAVDVDPALKELVFTFDQPMQHKA